MIQLQIEEAKEKIRNSITEISNSNNIDYYFLFDILKEILLEIEPKREQELNELRQEQIKQTQQKKESDNK